MSTRRLIEADGEDGVLWWEYAAPEFRLEVEYSFPDGGNGVVSYPTEITSGDARGWLKDAERDAKKRGYTIDQWYVVQYQKYRRLSIFEKHPVS